MFFGSRVERVVRDEGDEALDIAVAGGGEEKQESVQALYGIQGGGILGIPLFAPSISCLGPGSVTSPNSLYRLSSTQLLPLLLSLLAVLVGVLYGRLWAAEGVAGGKGVRILAREVDLAWSARCSGE